MFYFDPYFSETGEKSGFVKNTACRKFAKDELSLHLKLKKINYYTYKT